MQTGGQTPKPKEPKYSSTGRLEKKKYGGSAKKKSRR